MRAYIVSYDLNKPGQNYENLYEELKKSPRWWHFWDATWIIATSESPKQIWSRMKPHTDSSDNVLIIRACADYSGFLPKKAWEWIAANVPGC